MKNKKNKKPNLPAQAGKLTIEEQVKRDLEDSDRQYQYEKDNDLIRHYL